MEVPITFYGPHGNKTEINLMVDTGSRVSIITPEMYRTHFNHLPIQPTSRRFSAYGWSPLEVWGIVYPRFSYQGREQRAPFYIIRGQTPLLGLNLLKLLELEVRGKDLTVNHITTEDILSDFSTLFQDTLGRLKGFQHEIQIQPNVVPVAQKLRRVPFALREMVTKELITMERDGIIERIDAADWVHPIVPVVKPSGEVRVCTDLRELNKAVISDRFPLPTMEEILPELRKATVFSKLDFRKAYFQLELSPKCRRLTGFLTHEGLFQYCRLPMGYKSAGSTFQKTMQLILAGLPGTIVSSDDR